MIVVRVKLLKGDGSVEDLGDHDFPINYRVGAWVYPTVDGTNDRYKVARNDPKTNTVYVEHDPLLVT